MASETCDRCGWLVPAQAWRCHHCGRFAPALLGLRRPLTRFFDPGFSQVRAFAGVLAAIYLLEFAVSQAATASRDQSFSLTTSPSADVLFRMGSFLPLSILDGEWWRLLTSTLLHGSALHLGFNASSLLVAGPFVEEIFGPARFWVLFVVTGIGGGVASLFFAHYGMAVGASGAIFGLIGAMLAYGWKRGGSFGRDVREYALKWLGFGVVFSFLPGIGMVAHLGGAATGLAVGWILKLPQRGRRMESDIARLAGVASLLALVVCAGACVLANVRHGRDYTIERRLESVAAAQSLELERETKRTPSGR